MRRLLLSLFLLPVVGCGGQDQGGVDAPAAARVMVSAEPPGQNCAAGGQRIEVGVDRDGDGTLSPAEIGETAYICNGKDGNDGPGGRDGLDGRDGADGQDGAGGRDGMDGEDGQTPLVLVRPEPRGPNCAAGGQRIDVGFDDDLDGALTGEEIDQTVYVCDGVDGQDGAGGRDGTDGEDGQTPLVLVTPEPRGPNCAAGGQRVDVGFDDDLDGALTGEEIDQTVYVCNGTDGVDGQDGLDGEGCTVTKDISVPLATMSCPDGSKVTWRIGVTPPDISSGAWHTCALRFDGTIVCWGLDDEGQASPPTPPYYIPTETFRAVSSGWDHGCAIRADHTVACWGSNDWSQATPPPGQFKMLSSGEFVTCGLRMDDTIQCWGWGASSYMKPPSGTFRSIYGDRLAFCGVRTDDTLACWGVNNNQQLNAPSGRFKAVAVGFQHGCAIKMDGEVECWGMHTRWDPPPPGPFQSLTVGVSHTCGIKEDNTVTCWGHSEQPSPEGEFFSVSAGRTHTCGIRMNGQVHCWGENDFGQVSPLPDDL